MISKIEWLGENWLGISTLAVAFLTLIVSFLLWRRTRQEELSRLRSLFQQLDEIKRIAKDQYEYLKTKGVPSWKITNIDLNFYLTHINHKIAKETTLFNWVYTRELKKQLIDTHDKINNINNLYNLMYQAHVTNTPASKKQLAQYQAQLVQVSYYADLEKFIERTKTELKKILRKGEFCNKTWY